MIPKWLNATATVVVVVIGNRRLEFIFSVLLIYYSFKRLAELFKKIKELG